MTLSPHKEANDMITLPTVHAEPWAELDTPSYRVNFWSRPSEFHAWNLDAFIVLRAADFSEVLAWAEMERRGRPFEILVETDEEPYTSFATPRKTTLVRLYGKDLDALVD